MKQVVLAVFDQASGLFGRPLFVAAVGQAVRSFTDEVNRDGPENALFLHPEDFSLFELGSFDDETGRVVSLDIPKRVASGADVSVKGK